MNTLGKILAIILADDLKYVTEKYELLPDTHFGGRPGRTTTDAIHLLTSKIKHAWRNSKVVSVLFLDIEGAFPNVVVERLAHNMRMRRVPEYLVHLIEHQLRNRQTRLKFDNYTSEWIPIDNGSGQGDPKSMLEYLYYNADLIDIVNTFNDKDPRPATTGSARDRGKQKMDEAAAAFVDDAWLAGIGKDFKEANATLVDMMERKGGGLQWSKEHNSKFEMSKLVYMGFSMARKDGNRVARPLLVIGGRSIEAETATRYLGVIIDEELRWKEQELAAVTKATKWCQAFRRMAKPAKGANSRVMKRIYKGVLIPKMTYALDTWYTPPWLPAGGKQRTGSVRALNMLTKIHQQCLLAIMGGMKSTLTDAMELHTNIPPLELQLDAICHRAMIRLATLPKSHPLQKITLSAANHQPLHHKNQIHQLMAIYQIPMWRMETVSTTRRDPGKRLPYVVEIADTREESREEDETDEAEIKIYTDGSSKEEGVGAVAVLTREGVEGAKEKRKHLGKRKRYTVANAEAVGIILAVKLLEEEENVREVTVNMDNQSVLRSINSEKTGPGHAILDHFNGLVEKLKTQHPGLKLKLRWISGHDGVEGNEEADRLANVAAEGATTINLDLGDLEWNSEIPISASALKT